MSPSSQHGTHKKTRINELGCARFAKETNQHLIDFYSMDKWVVYEDTPEKVIGRKRRKWVKALKIVQYKQQISTNCGELHPMQHNTFQKAFIMYRYAHYVRIMMQQNYAL